MDTNLFIPNLNKTSLNTIYNLYKDLYYYKVLLDRTEPTILNSITKEITILNSTLPQKILINRNTFISFCPTYGKNNYIKINNM